MKTYMPSRYVDSAVEEEAAEVECHEIETGKAVEQLRLPGTWAAEWRLSAVAAGVANNRSAGRVAAERPEPWKAAGTCDSFRAIRACIRAAVE